MAAKREKHKNETLKSARSIFEDSYHSVINTGDVRLTEIRR
jgi:hypothetical protein